MGEVIVMRLTKLSSMNDQDLQLAIEQTEKWLENAKKEYDLLTDNKTIDPRNTVEVLATSPIETDYQAFKDQLECLYDELDQRKNKKL